MIKFDDIFINICSVKICNLKCLLYVWDTYLSSRLGEFLSSKQEFVKEQKENSTYEKYESTALKKARAIKNALRKKAFGKNSTKNDMDQFRQAVKTHNYLKKLDESKHKQNTSRRHESLYRKNFYKFAKNCTMVLSIRHRKV